MLKTKIKKLLGSAKYHNQLFLVLIVFLWMGVLVFANYSNDQNLRRNELNRNIKELTDQERLLSSEISQLQATERLEKESQKLNLVKIQTEDILYLAAGDGRVALR